ncbi:MAG: signal peptide peptidase SppA [Phycisphaerales bacterium]|jgi:protease-4|nr:signal peptide peptidase SppA [Phycisphaerales bacterium]
MSIPTTGVFRSVRTWSLALGAACATILAPACAPLEFKAVLGPGEPKASEGVVLSDDGAPSAKVAMIDLRGVIADARAPGLFGSGPSVLDDTLAHFERARNDEAVKAVVLRINSPGGSVTASDVLASEIERFREETGKPVVASMADVAASGGYYVALACDRIIAHESTLTGSIGVIFPTLNMSSGLAKIGIVSRPVVSGPNKNIADPLSPMQDAHYAILQGIVDDMYARFRARVVEHRPGLDTSRLGELTDGRIMTGSAAREAGLVDETGDLHDAFALAKKLAGLPRAKLVKYTSDGVAPRTPYAIASGEPRAASEHAGAPGGASGANSVEINVLSLQLGSVFGSSPTAYYLWMPTLP